MCSGADTNHSLVKGPPGWNRNFPAAYFLEAWRAAWKHPMLTDAAILLLVFAAGYGLRASIVSRRRLAVGEAREQWTHGLRWDPLEAGGLAVNWD